MTTREQEVSPATAKLLAQIDASARDRHPERFAPNGEPLTAYPGRGWDERRESWQRAHPEFQTPPSADVRDLDAPSERIRAGQAP